MKNYRQHMEQVRDDLIADRLSDQEDIIVITIADGNVDVTSLSSGVGVEHIFVNLDAANEGDCPLCGGELIMDECPLCMVDWS